MANNTNSSTSSDHVSRETYIILLSVGVVVSFLVVVSNLATILTFIINRRLRRRNVYCLMNLAVADMLQGVFRTVAEICLYDFYFGPPWVPYKILISVIAINDVMYVICLFSLVLVSLERVYATFFPFRHRTTRLRIYNVVFAITWLLVLPVGPFVVPGSLTRVDNLILVTISVILFLVCLIIICTSYTAIFVKVKNQTKRLQPNQQRTAIRRTQQREEHLAKTLFIVTVLSLITWVPLIIITTCMSWQYLQRPYDISLVVHRLVIILHLTNSLINPIIYVLRMRDYRKALSQLIFKCSRDRQRNLPIGHHGNHRREREPVIELGFM